ncbi:MAG: LemA family protein [Candidatus Microgenomates bacterium]|jgi:LemA protein
MIYVLLIIGVILLIWAVTTYNFFVGSKARIKAAVQEIGNQLKRQADLIPNLEESTKGYLSHEKGIFEMLTEARKAIAAAVDSGDVQKMSEAGTQLAQVLPSLRVAVESNPELKASEVVINLMDELRDTSDKIMYARRLVIDLTADFNVKRATVPSNIIANAFGFAELPGLITPQEGEHLEVSEQDLETPKVKLN